MNTIVKKWGNSASVRLPAAIMQAAHLSLDQQVEVREEDGRIIIEPIHTQPYDLATLIAGITEQNRHDLIDDDAPVGNEAW